MTFRSIVTTRKEAQRLTLYIGGHRNQWRRKTGLPHIGQITHCQIMPGQNRWCVVIGFEDPEELCDGEESYN